ncbi:MAG: hypothetical protein ACRDZ7_17150 [Acidimicrobiia bacterium]
MTKLRRAMAALLAAGFLSGAACSASGSADGDGVKVEGKVETPNQVTTTTGY